MGSLTAWTSWCSMKSGPGAVDQLSGLPHREVRCAVRVLVTHGVAFEENPPGLERCASRPLEDAEGAWPVHRGRGRSSGPAATWSGPARSLSTGPRHPLHPAPHDMALETSPRLPGRRTLNAERRGSVLIGECTSDIGVHVHRNVISMCAPALPYVTDCLAVAARPPERRRRSGACGRRRERPPISSTVLNRLSRALRGRERMAIACASVLPAPSAVFRATIAGAPEAPVGRNPGVSPVPRLRKAERRLSEAVGADFSALGNP